MKKTSLIIGGVVLAGGAVVAYRVMTAPKITIESVDWLKKTVRYEMKARGVSSAGTVNLGDGKRIGGGGYILAVASTRGGTMDFIITKNGDQVLKRTVDFKNKRII